MTDRDEPLSDLAATVSEDSSEHDGEFDADAEFDADTDTHLEYAADTDAEFDDLFTREDVTEIDGERLWRRLEEDRSADTSDHSRDVRTVDKHVYCHKCDHFSPPPEVGCGRDGTDILGMPTLETFRVVDCPVVRENDDLERRSSGSDR
ncbi:hypothetical protein [Natrialba sp. INN-245]|uniref:hypothetical protein n=1 Tax=Natrialba sp. INN-245 TaxID=2690967 RepID=UPI0013127E95|nr:hypothetical protein [Natrialba sp. INN-245]MWV39456.1 hypothetical protein [Natrialba sp. INN-245]